jgi:hypothetical protein
VKRFIAYVVISAAVVGCGSGDDNLPEPQQALLSGVWKGQLELAGGSCSKEDAEPSFEATVVVEGESVDVGLNASNLYTFNERDSSHSAGGSVQRIELDGETLGDGGFVADMINDDCPRCASAKLVFLAPLVENVCEEGVCSDRWVSESEFTYVPLNGPGGCSSIWKGKLVRHSDLPAVES